MVSDEANSFSFQDKTNFGALEGTLWVWSYREHAFICAGETHVLHAEMDGTFEDNQATTVRDSVRMRALAQALGALRSVDPRQ